MLSSVRIIVTALALFTVAHSAPVDSGSGDLTHNLVFKNKCSQNIWLASSTTWDNTPLPANGGLLIPGETFTITVVDHWQGRFWGRTECNFQYLNSTTNAACATGDCGSGEEYCGYISGRPPATLAEFDFNGWDDLDYYDISLVDGYNLPISIQPQTKLPAQGDPYSCGSPTVEKNINSICPSPLQILDHNGEVVGCKSACNAFGSPQYCCAGAYNSSQTCQPSSYSKLFKSACPSCYSFAFDDATSTFTCKGDYTIQFC
ncbi:thaumatin-like protein precursor [Basidiobolus meristosporus CBS 931.73]|uniref:Thaumatin-like protein n=1 Tax=Basidiobolus meristosporus CBS 931.73 TaxID=1314790 RepID=A0A1Y1XXJ4_9FUNG|nr:thaumatin-like protein precursor [Basidiobolus meristosporus CBS 931.73]|eukprot:ORX90458.1 thaumatin-like protein precursor [Basidiobolus meristosporus CBS 931.73]